MIYYLANVRLPTYRAHGIQMMKMCEALGAKGVPLTLVVPHKHHTVTGDPDPFIYFNVRPTFTIKRLTTLDLLGVTHFFGSLFYTIDLVSFIIAIRFGVRFTKGDIAYVRDPFLFSAVPKGVRRIAEVHEVPKHSQFIAMLKTAEKVFALTNALRDDLIRAGLSADRISVLPDAVDTAEFANPESKLAARTRLGIKPDALVAMYIGRLDGWKGLDTVYRAAPLLPGNVQVVVIGGDDVEVPTLAQLHPRVTFLGPRPYTELKHNMAAADVLLLPNTAQHASSARYTSPLKLFAYMTSGKPIVASDLVSLREVLNEHNAVLVPPDDPQALADGVVQALTKGVALAAQARQDVEPYTWDTRATRVTSALDL